MTLRECKIIIFTVSTECSSHLACPFHGAVVVQVHGDTGIATGPNTSWKQEL